MPSKPADPYVEEVLERLRGGSSVARDRLVRRGEVLGVRRGPKFVPILRFVRPSPSGGTRSPEVHVPGAWVWFGELRGTAAAVSRGLLGDRRASWEWLCDPEPAPPFPPGATHLVHGDLAGGSVRTVFRGASIAATYDVFSEGRCRFEDGLDLADWLACRERLWGARDRRRGERAARAIVRGIGEAAEVVVWTGTTLDAQLHTCWLAAVVPQHVPMWLALPLRPPHLGADDAYHVGMVHPAWLVTAGPVRLEGAERERLAALWRAFVSPDPAAFFALARAGAGSPTTDALSAWLGAFPDRRTGLTAWEERLMARVLAHDGETAAHTLTALLIEQRGPDQTGDGILLLRLKELVTAGLLRRERAGGQGYAAWRYRATALGQAVAAGERNRVEEAGFDRWLGGAHVTTAPGGAMWWRAGDALVGPTP